MNGRILYVMLAASILLAVAGFGCRDYEPTSDERQQQDQEKILQEATNATGMPAIKNFRERRLLKMILELRDQNNLSTYTYLWSDVQGKWIFFCDSIGYGVPYATQYTNPQKTEYYQSGRVVLPQADPNGLFSPASADGTWVMCKDPEGKDVKPVFIEPRAIVSPFKLPSQEVATAATTIPVAVTVEKKK